MPVSMFVVKIDSSNSWVSSATSPSAVMIATSAISSGNQARDNRAEHEQQDDQRCR